MNKSGLIKFVFVFIAAAVSLYFMITVNGSGFDSVFNIVMIFDFIIALAIYMFSNRKKVIKNKFIYNVTFELLSVFSLIYILFFMYSQISCYFSIDCEIEPNTIFTLIYPVLFFIMVLFSFRDIFNKTYKNNDILTILVSILIIFIHCRYYLEPAFTNDLIGNDSYVQHDYYYVAQNYVYFVIMYLVILIHRKVNKAT